MAKLTIDKCVSYDPQKTLPYALRRRTDKPFPVMLTHKLVAAFLLIVWFLITFWLFWPYNPLDLNSDIRILNLNNQVRAGEFLSYEYDVEKKLDMTATIHKQLVNSLLISYSPTSSNVPLGKRTVYEKLIIPVYAEGGEYRLRIEAVYKVNPLRDISVVGWSKPFHVSENR